jgi:hypothetical protein
MPKDKGLYVHLPRLLKRQAVDLLMLGYVMGYRHVSPIPVLQIRKGIQKFMEDMGLGEDDYPLDSAIVTYYRMLGEYNKFKYNDKSDQKWNCGHI